MSQVSADLFSTLVRDKLAVKVDPSWFKSMVKPYDAPHRLYSKMQNSLRFRLGNQKISDIYGKAEKAMKRHKLLPEEIIQREADRRAQLIANTLPEGDPFTTELRRYLPGYDLKPVSFLADEAIKEGFQPGSQPFYDYIKKARSPYLQGPEAKLPELLSNAEISHRLADIFR